jgi:hypothetical protein
MNPYANHPPPPQEPYKFARGNAPEELVPAQHYQAYSPIIKAFVLPNSIIHFDI